jgi:hypothetical protein
MTVSLFMRELWPCHIDPQKPRGLVCDARQITDGHIFIRRTNPRDFRGLGGQNNIGA